MENVVAPEECERTPGDPGVVRTALTELDDGGARLPRSIAVVAAVRSRRYVRLDTDPALLANELVERALGSADIQRPQDVQDPVAAIHRNPSVRTRRRATSRPGAGR